MRLAHTMGASMGLRGYAWQDGVSNGLEQEGRLLGLRMCHGAKLEMGDKEKPTHLGASTCPPAEKSYREVASVCRTCLNKAIS